MQAGWILGGVEVVSGKLFLTTVPNREAKTLLEAMKKYIRQGSVITVDCWRGYRPIDFSTMNWTYQCVNHNEYWKDPETGFCTNVIGTAKQNIFFKTAKMTYFISFFLFTSEGNWRHLKRGAVPNQKYHEKLIQPYLIVMVWRRLHNNNLWNRLLLALKNCPKDILENSNVEGSNDEDENSDTEEETGDPNDVDLMEEDSQFKNAPVMSAEEVIANEQRLMRAQSQVMRIMTCRKKTGIFSIKSAGKTGLYIVRIKTIPTCTCPDFEKGWICKHLKAILLSAYKVSSDSPLLLQRIFHKEDLVSLNINVALCERDLDEHDIGQILSVKTY